MIWSSLARNRSPSPVVSGFFGRILPLRCDEGITTGDSRETSKSKLQSSAPSSLKSLQSQNLPRPENRLSLNALAIVHGRLPYLASMRWFWSEGAAEVTGLMISDGSDVQDRRGHWFTAWVSLSGNPSS